MRARYVPKKQEGVRCLRQCVVWDTWEHKRQGTQRFYTEGGAAEFCDSIEPEGKW